MAHRLNRLETGGVVDDLVALALRRVDHRLAGVGTARDRLGEAVQPAAEHDVHLVIDGLLGDRAPASRGLGLGGAGGDGVLWTLTGALGDVRVEHGRRRVGDLRRRDVAGRLAFALGVLEDRPQVLTRDRDRRARALRDALVEGLMTRGPHRPRRRRVGVVVGQVRRRRRGLHRPRGVKPRERKLVDVQPSGRAHLVVARRGDLLRAHPVAEEEDDVAHAVPRLELVPDLVGPTLASRRRQRCAHREHRDDAEGDESRDPFPGTDHGLLSLGLVDSLRAAADYGASTIGARCDDAVNGLGRRSPRFRRRRGRPPDAGGASGR